MEDKTSKGPYKWKPVYPIKNVTDSTKRLKEISKYGVDYYKAKEKYEEDKNDQI